MSLVLAAVHGRRALIVTDGAVTRFWSGGQRTRVQSDRPKVHLVAPGVAIASTGSHIWLSDLVTYEVSEYVRTRGAATFDEIVAFMTMHLPEWHRELEQRIAEARRERSATGGTSALNGQLGTVVALVGGTQGAPRARMVIFSQDRGYAPFETGVVTFGSSALAAQHMLLAALKQTPGQLVTNVATAMRGIVETIARTDDVVGGTVYFCQIDLAPDDGPATTCISVIGETP